MIILHQWKEFKKHKPLENKIKITEQFLYASKTLEINPKHPDIKQLKEVLSSSDKVSEML